MTNYFLILVAYRRRAHPVEPLQNLPEFLLPANPDGTVDPAKVARRIFPSRAPLFRIQLARGKVARISTVYHHQWHARRSRALHIYSYMAAY